MSIINLDLKPIKFEKSNQSFLTLDWALINKRL